MGGLSVKQALTLYASENPFVTVQAFANSNYSLYHDGSLIRLLDWHEPPAKAKLAHHAFLAFVRSPKFSCVGAKAAIATGGYRYGYYRAMDDPGSTEGLARDLCAFSAEYGSIDARYKTFVAVFGRNPGDELAFERALWDLLAQLHALDEQYFEWDPSVSADPADKHFAFSFAGMAFFAVGLHPGASRDSRRLTHSAIAFNAHPQFRDLRITGAFERVRQSVRARELELQGTLNPNLAEYGERSEARQYSGRAVEDQWRCPFRNS